jgi:hypothetical protein
MYVLEWVLGSDTVREREIAASSKKCHQLTNIWCLIPKECTICSPCHEHLITVM